MNSKFQKLSGHPMNWTSSLNNEKVKMAPLCIRQSQKQIFPALSFYYLSPSLELRDYLVVSNSGYICL